MSDEVINQVITPDLKVWIVQQAQAGFPAEAVLENLVQAGWREEVALEAMETSLQLYLQEKKTEVEALPPTVPAPDIDWQGRCNSVKIDGHKITLVTALKHPRIMVFDHILSDKECDALIALSKPKLKRSETVGLDGGISAVHPDRTSRNTYFQLGENELVKTIEARLEKLFSWPTQQGEGLQILHYEPGQEYKPHYDFFDLQLPGSAQHIAQAGQRVATLLIYLNNPTAGGETSFPDIQFQVSPRKGSAVFFSYERPHKSTQTLHGGDPVISGEKWLATKWFREKPYQ